MLQVQPGGGADGNEPGVSSHSTVLSAGADPDHTLVSLLWIGLMQEYWTAQCLLCLGATAVQNVSTTQLEHLQADVRADSGAV